MASLSFLLSVLSTKALKLQSEHTSLVALVVKNSPANAGGKRDRGLIAGSGRSYGGGHDHALNYSCLENPMDRGVWRATVPGVAKSQTQVK